MARQPKLVEPPELKPSREELWISPEAIERIFGALESGPLTVRQIAVQTGYSDTHVGLCIRWFIKEGDVEKIRHKLPRLYRLKNG